MEKAAEKKKAPQPGTLGVIVESAKGLREVQTFGKQDPVCVVVCGSHSQKGDKVCCVSMLWCPCG